MIDQGKSNSFSRQKTWCARTTALVLVLVLMTVTTSYSQYKYGLKPMTYSSYVESVKSDPKNELVDLEKLVPGLVMDIRYATKNNFTGEQIYAVAKAYARRPVAESLQKIQAELKPLGLGIKMFDAYRPYKATVRFYEVYKDTTYVASPYKGSRHNRGCALDLTLIDLKTGQELPMPTEYDSFKKEAWPTTPVSDPVIRKNRTTLINVMEKYGFKVNGSEWWHYDFKGWKNYEVMDIDFHELE